MYSNVLVNEPFRLSLLSTRFSLFPNGPNSLSVSHVGRALRSEEDSPTAPSLSKRLPVVWGLHPYFTCYFGQRHQLFVPSFISLCLAVKLSAVKTPLANVLDATTLQECSSAQIASKLSFGVEWLSKPLTAHWSLVTPLPSFRVCSQVYGDSFESFFGFFDFP